MQDGVVVSACLDSFCVQFVLTVFSDAVFYPSVQAMFIRSVCDLKMVVNKDVKVKAKAPV